MSLTGDLQIFPLDEVLRLLARSQKSGCLRIDSAGLQGRVFLAGGSLTLATTVTDEDFRRQVVNAGLVSEDAFRQVEAGDASLTEVLAAGVSAAALTDFVREHVVESLYRIERPGRGAFDFEVDAAPKYPTSQSFDPEVVLAEADRRAAEWADIESAVTDLNASIKMVRDLPDENNVTIAPPTWRVLATLEGGASVTEIADQVGLSEFRAAREVAALLRTRLVEYQRQPAPVSEDPVWTQREPQWEPAAPSQQVEEPAPQSPAAYEPEAVPEGPAADAPEAFEADPVEADTAEPVPSSSTEETSPDRGWWDQAMGGDSAEDPSVEASEDAFLESVFSQLEESGDEEAGDDEDETGFSMGLLRRRRMGTVARDISDES